MPIYLAPDFRPKPEKYEKCVGMSACWNENEKCVEKIQEGRTLKAQRRTDRPRNGQSETASKRDRIDCPRTYRQTNRLTKQTVDACKKVRLEANSYIRTEAQKQPEGGREGGREGERQRETDTKTAR